MKSRSALLVLISVSVLTLLTIGVLLFSPLVFSGIDRQVTELIARYTLQLAGQSLHVSYRKISPALISGLSVYDVNLSSERGIILHVPRLQLRYSLLDLLQGSVRAAPRSLHVDRATLRLDLDRLGISDASVPDLSVYADLVRQALGGRSQPLALVLRNTNLELVGGTVPPMQLRLRYVSIGAGPDTLEYKADGRFWADLTKQLPDLGFVASPFSLGGSIALDSPAVSGLAQLLVFSKPFNSSQQQIKFQLDSGSLLANFSTDGGNTRLALRYDFASQSVEAAVDALRFRPSAIVSLNPGYHDLADWLSVAYSGSLGLGVKLRNPSEFLADLHFNGRLSFTAPIDMPGGRPALALDAYGTPLDIRFRSAAIRNAFFLARYAGSLSPARLGADGQLSLSYTPGLFPASSADFELYASDGAAFLYAPEVRLFSGSLYNASISLTLDEQDLYILADAQLPQAQKQAVEGGAETTDLIPANALIFFDTSAFNTSSNGGPSLQNDAAAVLNLEATVNLGEERYASARVRFDRLSPMEFVRDFTQLQSLDPLLLSMLERVRCNADLAVYTDFKAVSYSANNAIIALEGFNSVYSIVTLSGNLSSLSLSAINASIGSYLVRGTAGLDFRKDAPLAVRADIAVNEIPYLLNATIMDNSLFLSGDYGLIVRLETVDDQTRVNFRAESLPVELGGRVFSVSTALDAVYRSIDAWSCTVQNLNLIFPSGLALSPSSVALEGAVDQDGAVFNRFEIMSDAPFLSGGFFADWDFSDGFRTKLDLELSSIAGERYSLRGEYSQGRLDLALLLEAVELRRFIPTYDGRLDGSLSVLGPWQHPELELDFSLNPEASFGSTEVITRGKASYRDARLRVSGTSIDYVIFHIRNFEADLDFLEGSAVYSMDADAILPMTSAAVGVSGILEGKAALGAQNQGSFTEDIPSAADRPTDIVSVFRKIQADDYSMFKLRGFSRNFAVKDQRSPDWPYEVSIGREGFSFRIGENAEVGFSYLFNGRLDASIAQALPVSGLVQGSIANDQIALSLDGLQVDMPFLFDFLEIPMVKSPGGLGRGSLKISGAISDPDMEGQFDFSDFYLRVDDYMVDTIGPITQPLTVTGKTASLVQEEVRCGDALLQGRFSFDLESWIPSNILVLVQTRPLSLAHARTSILGMSFDILASADLSIQVNQSSAEIAGWVRAASGEAVISVETLTASQSGNIGGALGMGSLSDIKTSLDFFIGQNIQVYFPTKEPRIWAGQSDPASKLSIKYDSAQDEMLVKGTIILRGGDVFYIKRNFYLKSAAIVFNETSDSFNPLLTATAETRSFHEGQPVVISLRANNVPLKTMTFDLESVPPLSDIEIARLLGQDLTASGTDENETLGLQVGRAALENVDLIPGLDYVGLFERGIQNLFGFDLFYLRTKVLQRWIYDLSRQGAGGEALTLAEYLDSTSMVIGNYLADDLFFQTAVSLQEGQLEQQGDLQLNFELGLEWQTPHFLINWSLKPQNPQYLFIPDQSISLFWRIPIR